MNKFLYYLSGFGLLLITIFVMGYSIIIFVSNLPEQLKVENQTQLAGYWDPNGFVCINVRNVSVERAIELCRHEIGHEMFASACEENDLTFKQCSDFIDSLTHPKI